MSTADELRSRVHRQLPLWNDMTEDWPKLASWDFHRDDGQPVDTLADLELATGVPAEVLAEEILTLSYGSAAPPSLIEEARRRVGQELD